MRAALRILAFLMFVSLAASSGHADVSITPADPVAGVPFVAHVTLFCASAGEATINGGDINIPVTPFGSCCATCVSLSHVNIGPLPVGVYTIRLLSTVNNAVIETFPVVVVADIPALDPRLLAILAVALIAIAILRTQ